MSDNQPESKRPPPDARTPPLGGNFVWYLLALGIGVLFLVSFMETGNQVELSYMDLVKLIEKGVPVRNPKAAVELRETIAGKQEDVRYSNLDNLMVGPHEITGTVSREVISPEAERGKMEIDTGVGRHHALSRLLIGLRCACPTLHIAQRGTIMVKLSPQGNPSMPDNQPESNRPPPDRRTPSLGGNMIWYLLALGVGTLFLVSLMDTGSQVELRYIDLDKLIEKGRPEGRDRGHGGSAGQGTRSSATRNWTI